jgi:serine/threonine-protein kinase RsbW
MDSTSNGDGTAVELKIPCEPEYVGVARLMILGVASRMSFPYDQVEDLRLAVGEACTSAIGRSRQAGQDKSEITVKCLIQEGKLTIQVSDSVRGSNSEAAKHSGGSEPPEGGEISALLMEILVDEIRTESDPTAGTTVTMVKYLEGS